MPKKSKDEEDKKRARMLGKGMARKTADLIRAQKKAGNKILDRVRKARGG